MGSLQVLPQQAPIMQPKVTTSHLPYLLIVIILILVLIGIPLVIYPKIQKVQIVSPHVSPTPVLSIESAIATINTTQQSIQNTLSDPAADLTTFDSASPSAMKFRDTITLFTNEGKLLQTVAKQLTPITYTSANSLMLYSYVVNLNNNVNDIQIIMKADVSVLTLLTPTNNNQQKTIDTLKNDFAKVRQDLTSIQQDLIQIRLGLLLKPSPKPSLKPCLTRPTCLDEHPACTFIEPKEGWCTNVPTPPTKTPTSPTK